MLMVVKNQLKVMFLSIKYALMQEMLNKITFMTNILFMILNNAGFIVQWIVLYSLKDNIGGYSFEQILLLWGLASGTYGFAHFFFERAFSLSDLINDGKLDSYLVQPKNVLLSVATSQVSTAALGDILYAYIMLFIYGVTFSNFVLFTLFSFCGGIVIVSIYIIFASLSFWVRKSDFLADTANRLIISFATYPDGIFKGFAKILMYTIIPVGITNYMPVKIICKFNFVSLLLVLGMTVFFTCFAFFIFYKGLKRYSSSNLMLARF